MYKTLTLAVLILFISCKIENKYICQDYETSCCDKKGIYLKSIKNYPFRSLQENFSLSDKNYDVISVGSDSNYSFSLHCIYNRKGKLIYFRPTSGYCVFYEDSPEGKRLYDYMISRIDVQKVPDSVWKKEMVEEVREKHLEELIPE